MKKLSTQDAEFLKSLGISTSDAEAQIKVLTSKPLKREFIRTATLNDGIQIFTPSEVEQFQNIWQTYLEKGKDISFFIPASGNAARFFKELEDFLNGQYVTPQTTYVKNFFKHLSSFAFYNELNRLCIEKEKKDVAELMELGRFRLIVEYLLSEKGLNYRQLPHALFKFHTDKYKTFTTVTKYLPKKYFKYYTSWENTRTPIQESLIESSMVGGVKGGVVDVCFSVDANEREIIQDYVREFKQPVEKKFGVQLHVSTPVQDTDTDTLVLGSDGDLLRDSAGNPVHRKSGHGALLQNLDRVQADVIFIKNIDNAAPDSLKKLTVGYRRMLGGVLVSNYKKIKTFLRMLDKDDVPDDKLIEIINFVENFLNVKRQNILRLPREEQIKYLHEKLNRPLRVCGMVKNEDEKGGVPCWVLNPDETKSLQIIDFYEVSDDSKQQKMFGAATHFNPVDMVCCIRDYKGKKFDLSTFADREAWMVCDKESVSGVKYRRIDRPGLWNGGMADWNTIFVEVPIKTFNPVKSINDLLRQEHQN